MIRIRWWIAILAALAAFPAAAYRREYNVTLDGSRKGGSEVCFFDARGTANAFDLYFTYKRVACLPADKVLDMPRGIFHAFARHRDGYVSGHPDYSVSDVDAREAGYQLLEIPVTPAARVDFSEQRSAARAGVWLTPTPEAGGVFFPAVDGETSVMVPAGRTVVPLLVQDGVPVRVGLPLTLERGETRKPEFPMPARGTTTVVAWAKVDDEESAPLAGIPPPSISAVGGGVEVEPLGGTNPAPTHTLLVFKDVPAGEVELRTRGRFWAHSEQPISTSDAPVTAIRDPILLLPASALTISWDLAPEATTDDSCGGAPASRPRRVITIFLDRCAETGGAEEACTPVQRHAEPFATRQSVSLEGILPGRYRLRVVPPATRAVAVPVELHVGREMNVRVPLPSFRLFGTVRLNGAPLHARLAFSTGEATSDTAGSYTAVLTGNPRGDVVRIEPCAGGSRIMHRPEEPAAENSAFDIDLRTNQFTATVVDPQEARVSGASVNFAVVHSSTGGVQYHSDPVLTDAAGRALIAHAPAGKTVIVCAEHAGHQRTCSTPRAVNDLAKAGVSLRFEPVAVRGRIAGHRGRALLAWVDPGGTVREQVAIADDGRFAFRKQHPAGSYLVYTSTSRPLTVLPSPLAGSVSGVVIELPNAPVRSFAVTVKSAARNGFIGVWIGGRYVPLDLLAFHHDHRGFDITAKPNRPVYLRDLAETGPITVAFAPEELNPGPFIDPFVRPEYLNLERYPVTGPTVVIP